MSLAELAKMVGISKSMMYYIETNQRKLSFEIGFKVSLALNVNMEDLIKQ